MVLLWGSDLLELGFCFVMVVILVNLGRLFQVVQVVLKLVLERICFVLFRVLFEMLGIGNSFGFFDMMSWMLFLGCQLFFLVWLVMLIMMLWLVLLLNMYWGLLLIMRFLLVSVDCVLLMDILDMLGNVLVEMQSLIELFLNILQFLLQVQVLLFVCGVMQVLIMMLVLVLEKSMSDFFVMLMLRLVRQLWVFCLVWLLRVLRVWLVGFVDMMMVIGLFLFSCVFFVGLVLIMVFLLMLIENWFFWFGMKFVLVRVVVVLLQVLLEIFGMVISDLGLELNYQLIFLVSIVSSRISVSRNVLCV